MKPSYGESSHYLGERGEQYFAHNVHAEVGGQIEARKFAPFIGDRDSVLDFGCGGGFTLKRIQCARRIGVEINPVARKAALESGIECYSDLAEVPDSSADVVISNHALEHVPSPIQALGEINRTLRTPGILVLVLPIDDWRSQKSFDPSDRNHHLYTWNPLLIGNCLVEAGFDPGNFRINVFSHAWFPGYHAAFPRLPGRIFDSMCYLYSVLVKRRQILAVVRKVAGTANH